MSKQYAGAESQTPKAVSFTESMADQTGVAFITPSEIARQRTTVNEAEGKSKKHT